MVAYPRPFGSSIVPLSEPEGPSVPGTILVHVSGANYTRYGDRIITNGLFFDYHYVDGDQFRALSGTKVVPLDYPIVQVVDDDAIGLITAPTYDYSDVLDNSISGFVWRPD